MSFLDPSGQPLNTYPQEQREMDSAGHIDNNNREEESVVGLRESGRTDGAGERRGENDASTVLRNEIQKKTQTDEK